MPKQRRRVNGIHAERLRQIRPFVSFNYDLREKLSRSAQKKIKRYHDEIAALTNRPYQVYRPRLTGRLRAAQEFAQHDKYLPQLRVAFIPTDGTNKVRLSFTRSGIRGHTEHVSSEIVRLSLQGLLINAEAYVRTRLRNHSAEHFTIQAGRYEIPIGYLKETVPRAVARLVNKYSNEQSNHYFGRWLHGLRAYYYENQGALSEYLREKQEAIKDAKRERRRIKDRNRKRKQ